MIRSRSTPRDRPAPRDARRDSAASASSLTTAEVVQELLALIQAEGLVSGDRLPSIRQLSTRLGVRPHTVRDALLQAQTLGHVKVRPRARAIVQGSGSAPGTDATSVGAVTVRGSYQLNLHPLTRHEASGHHFFHLLEARQVIELETVRQAAVRRRVEDLLPVREELDAMNAIHEPQRRQEFVEHDLQFHLAIARVAGNPVLTAMLKPLLTSLEPLFCREPFVDSVVERVRRSHAEIFRALVAGDATTAQERMRDHLQLAYDYLLHEIQTLPEESS